MIEHYYKHVIEQAEAGIVIRDMTGRWLYANQAVRNLLGYSEAELVNQSGRDLTAPDDRSNAAEFNQKIQSGEIDTYTREKFYIHKNGTHIPVEVTITTIRDDAGKPVLLAGLVLTGLMGFLLVPMLAVGRPFEVTAFLAIALLCMGLIFGPMGAVLSELFPTQVRYTGASVTYNMGGILGASFAPLIALQLAEAGGLHYVGYYLTATAALSFIAIMLMRETRHETLG